MHFLRGILPQRLSGFLHLNTSLMPIKNRGINAPARHHAARQNVACGVSPQGLHCRRQQNAPHAFARPMHTMITCKSVAAIGLL
ncbi:hypothetical protein [Sulfuritalea sp.]|uniref:hypothetical protein n=1 Tax=Sulfuritalea sp. TaxID=2480090 RepID=UPI00286D72FF|nr:hypothetical protein [Sulfuritalea sp.]